MPDLEIVLQAEKLNFRRRQQKILHDVTLSLAAHEIVALIGGNGAGKTTLLDILIGKILPDRGKIRRAEHLGALWLGYLPDKAPLYPHWTVKEFLLSCAKIRMVKNPAQAVAEIIEACDLGQVAQKKCDLLSHGYRQRVGLAQALVHRPPIVVLDEPTNGLDYGQKQALRPLLQGLKTHCTVLLTSHDWEEVLTVADRVYQLSDGQVTEIPLPARSATQIWAGCIDANYAAKLATMRTEAIVDGVFVAFPYHNPTEKTQIWQWVGGQNGIVSLHECYPSEAFQQKLR